VENAKKCRFFPPPTFPAGFACDRHPALPFFSWSVPAASPNNRESPQDKFHLIVITQIIIGHPVSPRGNIFLFFSNKDEFVKTENSPQRAQSPQR
jgi:hypothetical protein